MQQQVERTVVTLEIVERLVLIGAERRRTRTSRHGCSGCVRWIVFEDMVADGLDQVGLSETDAAVHEQRVVRGRMLGYLKPARAGELIGLAGHEGLERESRIEARLLAAASAATGFGSGALGAVAADRRRGTIRRIGDDNGVASGRPTATAASSSMRPAKRSLTHLQHKAVGAIRRNPSPASSSRSGRIQVLNCCCVNSR